MKTYFAVIFLSLLLCSCANRDNAFEDWRQYLAKTPNEEIDPEYASILISEVYRKGGTTSYLWGKAREGNSENAVAACAILLEVYKLHKTLPGGGDFDMTGAPTFAEYVEHLDTIKTDQLPPVWRNIHSRTMSYSE